MKLHVVKYEIRMGDDCWGDCAHIGQNIVKKEIMRKKAKILLLMTLHRNIRRIIDRRGATIDRTSHKTRRNCLSLRE